MGNYEVFVECLRLYDRNDDGGIMKYDLENIICNMGKQLHYVKSKLWISNKYRVHVI